MKSFSVAVAVAIVLTSIYLQESSAVPITEDQQLIDSVNPPDAPVGEYPVFPADSWKMPYYFRQRNDPRRCRFCCNCCPGMRGCGVCCRF